jgi:2-amino-4-hydroxy-6-hydroxymethyldihydropteridine diphosphokinase
LESRPWGNPNQPNFLNQVLLLDPVSLDPQKLLFELKSLESRFGRWKENHFGPRIIDLDILYYGSQNIQSNDLIVPHAQIRNRRFVLQLLKDINSEFVDPVTGIKIDEMLANCPDDNAAWLFKKS